MDMGGISKKVVCKWLDFTYVEQIFATKCMLYNNHHLQVRRFNGCTYPSTAIFRDWFVCGEVAKNMSACWRSSVSPSWQP